MYAIRSYYGNAWRCRCLDSGNVVVVVVQQHTQVADRIQRGDDFFQPCDGFFGSAHDDRVARITSYNVCYTKLLRERDYVAPAAWRLAIFGPYVGAWALVGENHGWIVDEGTGNRDALLV